MKKKMFLAPMIGLMVAPLAGCTGPLKADLVIYGNIFTAESENGSLAEAFAVRNGKYIYVGDKEGVQQHIKEGTQVIDRENLGLIIPGCTEGHAHYFDGVGLNSQLPGSGKSYEEVLEILRNKFNNEHITQFVSFGWETVTLSEKRKSGFNFAEEIEQIAPGIPVVLIDNSGHAAVCNKTALQKAGITKTNPRVRGGAVDVDANGEPSGYVGDQAVFYVADKTIGGLLSEEQYKNACEYGMNELLRFGYTNALDAFMNMYDAEGLYKALSKMDKEKKLKINLAECYNIKSFEYDDYQTVVNKVAAIKKNYSTKHCNSSYIKLFLDGVVESGTGWISGTYARPVDGKLHGNIVWEQSELNDVIKYANKKDLIIHAHTYGDAACNAALNSFIESNQVNKKEYRNCLAHVRNINTEDVERAAENKIPVAANLLWHSDYDVNDPTGKYIRDLIIDNIGEDYYNSGYPMKSLLNKGVVVSSSTDAPAAVEFEGNILNVIEVATTGQVPEDTAAPFATNELLTVEEALKTLTINGAWQLGLEKERGSIKVGKYADFVVIDKNILNYEGEELRTIHEAKILNTYFEGEKVYTAK